MFFFDFVQYHSMGLRYIFKTAWILVARKVEERSIKESGDNQCPCVFR